MDQSKAITHLAIGISELMRQTEMDPTGWRYEEEFTSCFIGYMMSWYRAIPVKAIIIGQNPYPDGSFDDSGAAFAHKVGPTPPSVRVIAADLEKHSGCPSSVSLAVLQHSWSTIEDGIIFINESLSPNCQHTQSLRHASIQTMALVTLMDLSYQPNADPIELYCYGTAAAKMGNMITTLMKNTTTKIKKYTSAHPAAIAREASDPSEYDMKVPAMSRALGKRLCNIVVDDYTTTSMATKKVQSQAFDSAQFIAQSLAEMSSATGKTIDKGKGIAASLTTALESNLEPAAMAKEVRDSINGFVEALQEFQSLSMVATSKMYAVGKSPFSASTTVGAAARSAPIYDNRNPGNQSFVPAANVPVTPIIAIPRTVTKRSISSSASNTSVSAPVAPSTSGVSTPPVTAPNTKEPVFNFSSFLKKTPATVTPRNVTPRASTPSTTPAVTPATTPSTSLASTPVIPRTVTKRSFSVAAPSGGGGLAAAASGSMSSVTMGMQNLAVGNGSDTVAEFHLTPVEIGYLGSITTIVSLCPYPKARTLGQSLKDAFTSSKSTSGIVRECIEATKRDAAREGSTKFFDEIIMGTGVKSTQIMDVLYQHLGKW